MSDELMAGQEDFADSLSDGELRLLYSLGSLGNESLPAIPRAENAELADSLAQRGMLCRIEGSDPRVRRYGAYTLTARGFEAFNRRVCRRARGQSAVSQALN
jgi:hypothetical protein